MPSSIERGNSVDLPAPGGAVTTRRGFASSDSFTCPATEDTGNQPYFSQISIQTRYISGLEYSPLINIFFCKNTKSAAIMQIT